MDLNSTSSENSGDMNMDKWDDLSEHSDDEEKPEDEIDHDGAREENTDQRNEEDLKIDKRSESTVGGTASAGLPSPSKVELSEDRVVVSTLTSNQPDENADQDPETLFEFESNKDELELLQLTDETSEHYVTSPTASSYEHFESNVGDLESGTAQSVPVS